MIDTTGSVVVKYSYDAWGYNGVSDINGNVISDENHIGNLNPFRYRGYYYDAETKLYYLKTRYYDPETGRFISQDDIEYIEPDSINGLNLYAYCFNNPIGLCDPSGCSALAALIIGLLLLFTPVGGTVWQITASVLGYAGIAIASLFDKDIKNDMDSIGWNPFNANESLVTGSTKVSFYKGAPVFRIDASKRSWSFGAIFLAVNDPADELRHERGHNWQLMMMGLAIRPAIVFKKGDQFICVCYDYEIEQFEVTYHLNNDDMLGKSMLPNNWENNMKKNYQSQLSYVQNCIKTRLNIA